MRRALVVGAGMAGLAAARTLADAGVDATVLEARDRLGGRTWTDTQFAGIPVELGGEYIHGDQVVTWEYVRKLGLRTLHWNKQDDSMVRTEGGEWLTMSQARAADAGFDLTRSWDLPDVPAGPYEDLAGYLRRVGFSREQLRYVERSFANAKSETMRFISARSVLRGFRRSSENGNGDFRILDGYGVIARHLAEGMDVRLGQPVEAIEPGGSRVSFISAAGERLEADAAVLAVPLGVLQAGTIRFRPGLSEEKARALAGLRMGPVIKMLYRFDERVAEPGVGAVYSRLNPPMWWSPSGGHDLRGQVWSAFVSGSWATSLLALGEEGALAAGVETLSAELGRRVEPVASMLVNWPEDPYARGGYSFVLPGNDGAREQLAIPEPPLFFCGEATAPEHQAATVHGAIESGRRAAKEVMAYLGTPLPRASAVGEPLG
jgi:monoamine oxidase